MLLIDKTRNSLLFIILFLLITVGCSGGNVSKAKKENNTNETHTVELRLGEKKEIKYDTELGDTGKVTLIFGGSQDNQIILNKGIVIKDDFEFVKILVNPKSKLVLSGNYIMEIINVNKNLSLDKVKIDYKIIKEE